MPRGGRREGAGRRAGTVTRKKALTGAFLTAIAGDSEAAKERWNPSRRTSGEEAGALWSQRW
jgi:hypothetical protein